MSIRGVKSPLILKEMLMKIFIAVFAMLLLCGSCYAVSLYAKDETYLGELSSNSYDPNSTSNPYGVYGSPYSSTSINNPYGVYGSKYSPLSPNNPYAKSNPYKCKDR